MHTRKTIKIAMNIYGTLSGHVSHCDRLFKCGMRCGIRIQLIYKACAHVAGKSQFCTISVMMLCNIRPIQYESKSFKLFYVPFVIIFVFAWHIIQLALHVVMKYEMRNESINLLEREGGGLVVKVHNFFYIIQNTFTSNLLLSTPIQIYLKISYKPKRNNRSKPIN